MAILASLVAGAGDAGANRSVVLCLNVGSGAKLFSGVAPLWGTIATATIAAGRCAGEFRHCGLPHEMCPPVLKRPLGTAVELLAAIPSIIYGMWGLFVFAPLFAKHCSLMIDTLGSNCRWSACCFGARHGLRRVHRRLILAVMVIPFIASVMRDVFETTPPILKESAYGLGATTWEVVWNVVLPYTKAGVIGGIMLGLGRALGETMAVTFRDRQRLQHLGAALPEPGNSIASALANEIQRGVGPDTSVGPDHAGPHAVRAVVHRPRAVAPDAGKLAAREVNAHERYRANNAGTFSDKLTTNGEGNTKHHRLIRRESLQTAVPVHRLTTGLPPSALDQSLQPDDVAGDDGVRHGLPAVDLAILFGKGMAALAGAVYADDATTRIGRRARQRHRRQPDHCLGGHLHRHAGRHSGRHLSGEFGRNSTIAKVTRFINDILLSAPSIVIGLFVYTLLIVANAQALLGLAGAVALAIIAVPVIVRQTENMLQLVPNSLREAAVALGAPQWQVVLVVTLRAVKGGVVTGVLLALARISGETAPLLFTALNNQFWSTDLNAPMANLPVVIFQFAMSPLMKSGSVWPGPARC